MVFREIKVLYIVWMMRLFLGLSLWWGEVSKPHGSNCVAVSTWPLEATGLGCWGTCVCSVKQACLSRKLLNCRKVYSSTDAWSCVYNWCVNSGGCLFWADVQRMLASTESSFRLALRGFLFLLQNKSGLVVKWIEFERLLQPNLHIPPDFTSSQI